MKKEITNGSEKQIKWAADIRENTLNGLQYMKELGFDVDYTIERLEKASNAKWWIEKETGRGFGDVLPELEFTNKQGQVEKKDIYDFFYHKSRNMYAPRTSRTDVVHPKNIISIKEKIKEEDK